VPESIHGWFGEKRFEIYQGHTEFLRALPEAQVFGSCYAASLAQGYTPCESRMSAEEAVRSFRRTQGEEE
jgi:hypothetical protein